MTTLTKYDEKKHPRNPKGAKGGGKFAKKADSEKEANKRKQQEQQQGQEPAWHGEVRELQNKPSKQEAGALGERIAVAYLRESGLAPDARHLNTEHSNFPVDLIGDHMLIEVKTGLVSNSDAAQQWRATIGQPGKKETAWLAKARADVKAAWNERKKKAILDRKQKVLRDMSREKGVKLQGKTVALILDTDKKVADIYMFDGFHSRIGWKSDQAKAGYVKTIRYAA